MKDLVGYLCKTFIQFPCWPGARTGIEVTNLKVALMDVTPITTSVTFPDACKSPDGKRELRIIFLTWRCAYEIQK